MRVVLCAVLTCRRNDAKIRHGGFTLVELLVVLSILAAAAALLLPAVQAARESARRTVCKNNLRQIGMALQNYHSARGSFPPGGLEWRPAGNTRHRQIAWSALLLPYLEQQSLSERLDLSTPFDSPINAEGAAAVLAVYVCPTSPDGTQLVDGRGPCDYGGIFGERITSPNQPPKGIMLYDRAIRSEQVRDGLSRTFIVAEDTLWTEGQWINGRNVFDQAYAINAAPPFENDIRSLHPGGAQVLMADASVHFFDEATELLILAAHCTRAGGETVSASITHP
jgi:prepilin-type N-terminal cleavage/methylation domain-containing protein/prepilin-type processing-associated H-X9-DG protein